jgi:hypothetical protein
MQRHRCGEYEDGKFFGRSRAVMSKGRWGMLWRPLALWGPETTRFLADAGGPSRSYVQSGAAEVAEQLAGASVPRWSRPLCTPSHGLNGDQPTVSALGSPIVGARVRIHLSPDGQL